MSEIEKLAIVGEVVTESAAQIVNHFWFNTAQFCGCGNSERILPLILDLLNRHGPDDQGEFDGGPQAEFSNDLDLLLMYCFDAWELTEHGGSVWGAWLTDEGLRLRSAMRAVNLATVLDEDRSA